MKSAGGQDAAALIAKFVRTAMDFGVLEDVCSALEQGRLTPDCSAVTYGSIARGKPQVESAIAGLLNVWTVSYFTVNAETLALVIRACSISIQRERFAIPLIEVVWTGPSADGSFVRATNEVVRELIAGASNELLIVGFWLIAKENSDGPMSEILARVFDAVVRGVRVTMILDERRRPDGRDNKSILMNVWPDQANPPQLLTWKLPAEDAHVKLHAKVLVADQKDALITSANLTDYGMTKNIEMGVRLLGTAAGDISRHFLLLEEDDILTAL